MTTNKARITFEECGELGDPAGHYLLKVYFEKEDERSFVGQYAITETSIARERIARDIFARAKEKGTLEITLSSLNALGKPLQPDFLVVNLASELDLAYKLKVEIEGGKDAN